MHKALKYAGAAAVGVAALEFLYTTSWYTNSGFNTQGGAGGIAFDIAVAGGLAGVVGMFL